MSDHTVLPQNAPAAPALNAQPLTSRCQAVFSDRAHACVGISPFNSHFSAQRVHDLAHWALSTFDRVHFFVPDTAAVHTLTALGYPLQKATWKARRQGQYVRNKITKALTTLGVVHPGDHILDGQALEADTAYRDLREQAERHYRENPEFAEACLGASAWVMDRRLPEGQQPTADQLRCAVRYFLAELPLFLDTPRITGTGASVFCYHQVPDFLDDLFHHRLAMRPAPNQGYVQLT